MAADGAGSRPRWGWVEALRRLPPFPTAVLVVSVAIVAGVSIAQDVLAGLVAVAILLIGLWGSYQLGKETRKSPPVRQSFRHLARLQALLLALAERLAEDRETLTGHSPGYETERARIALSNAEFVVGQTVSFVGEAMEDWADLAPEEVEELRKELQAAKRDEQEVQRRTVVDSFQVQDADFGHGEEGEWVMIEDETQEP